ncbi:permease [Psychrobacillus psychrodurans]|uniref:permease n=1 Tax=Psychrobacillus psychrodurans TaxID=126157 RepID=UPI001F4D765D|nr:permease [Psychrobacillus psychrodurans]MCK1999086.1 permease [Psychrobacillus psychrodurans]
MFAGHFGVAAVVKSKAPELPLWSLLVSSQLLDIAFVPFSLAGEESIEPLGDGGYANAMIYAFYTHSFIGALVLSIIAAYLAGVFWGKKSAVITGAVVFSHWILDLIVHRPDMPIFPGNVGDFPLLGFGLWESVSASFLLEFLLISAGSFFYFRHALQSADPERRGKGIAAGCAMTTFLFLSLFINAFM